MKLSEPEFLTFDELAQRWDYSKAYLHDLIQTGRIIPAVALSDQERYPGGEFRGGYFVGDVDEAVHNSYAEYYVGSVVGEDSHPENWPQCSRTVFCQHPSDEGENDYYFQFFTESLDPGNTKKWFYFDHGYRITGSDGELRFRFFQSEIKRFEEDSAHEYSLEGEIMATEEILVQPEFVVQGTVVQDEAKSILHRTIQKRKSILETEIETARTRAIDPDDAHSVWAELTKMAAVCEGCLLGLGNNEVKYGTGEDFKFFTKKKLRNRMRSAKTR